MAVLVFTNRELILLVECRECAFGHGAKQQGLYLWASTVYLVEEEGAHGQRFSSPVSMLTLCKMFSDQCLCSYD